MAEIIYASSGDIREEYNAGAAVGDKGYKDETTLHGVLITRSARRATRVINGKLEGAYPNDIPFTTDASVPKLIKEIADDLSIYYVRRSKHPGQGPMADDVKADYFDSPMELLNEIAAGDTKLSELETLTSDRYTFHTMKGVNPVFNMGNIEDQEVDPDLLGTIADDRI